MATFLQLLFSGLALGAVYALIALGFVVIYRSSQVFNFAQGEFLACGALLMASLVRADVPWFLALLIALGGTGILAALTERIALRPLIGRPVFVTIIVTIFAGLIIRTMMLVLWGTDTRGMPTPWDTTATVSIGGAQVLVNSLVGIGAGVLALGLFYVLIRTTRIGVAMRATASDQETALALGIPVGKVFGITWFVAGALAALGGVFLGMFPNSVDTNLGFVALRAFPAVIVGGLESASGAAIAGILLGILEVMTQGYVNPHLGDFGHNVHTVFPYMVMIVFLVVRPYGLFGQATVKRV